MVRSPGRLRSGCRTGDRDVGVLPVFPLPVNLPGIPLEEQEKIFERFHQIAVETGSEGTGSGLGLAIAKWAVHLNDGSIELESEPGTGSIFRIILPEIME